MIAPLESFALWLYRKTGHFIENRMHELFMHRLLDRMGAPTHLDKDQTKLRLGAYGRLRAWAVEKGITKEDEVFL